MHEDKFRIINLENRNGLKLIVSNYGARICSILVPIAGQYLEVHDFRTNFEEYYDEHAYSGATIGPMANRLKDGRYYINGQVTTFSLNDDHNSLHAGDIGYHRRYWDIKEQKSDMVVFALRPLPSELVDYIVYTTFLLTDDQGIMIQFEATFDRDIHHNMTNHGFYNLSRKSDLSTHNFQIFADYYTPLDNQKLPTGEIRSVKNSSFDLRKPKQIGRYVYDHNFVLNKEEAGHMSLAAIVNASDTELSMYCYTTQPGLQFYTARHDAFCLETQHFPNSPNHTNFPSTLITSDRAYKEQCLYRFKDARKQFIPLGRMK